MSPLVLGDLQCVRKVQRIELPDELVLKFFRQPNRSATGTGNLEVCPLLMRAKRSFTATGSRVLVHAQSFLPKAGPHRLRFAVFGKHHRKKKVSLSCPIQPGDRVQTFFVVADQTSNQIPAIDSSQLNFPVLVDSQNRVTRNSGPVQFARIDFTIVDQVQQGLSGQLDKTLIFHYQLYSDEIAEVARVLEDSGLPRFYFNWTVHQRGAAKMFRSTG